MTTDVMKRNQSLTYDRINQVQDAVDQNKKSNEDISKNLEVNTSSSTSSWSFGIDRLRTYQANNFNKFSKGGKRASGWLCCRFW